MCDIGRSNKRRKQLREFVQHMPDAIRYSEIFKVPFSGLAGRKNPSA
jgi:hypothetical protein